MTHLYLVPQWFFGFDIGLEILFGIITLFVALSAYKIYKISKEGSMKNFGTGFLLVACSYIAWAIVNLSLFFQMQQGPMGPMGIPPMDFVIISSLGIYAHMILLAIGLITLVYATLGTRSPRTYYLLLGLGLVAVVASFDKIATFRIVSVFLLSYVVYHFFIQWQEHRNKNLLYSFIAFALLLASNLDFAFAGNYYGAYVIGHALELFAYLIILKNLISINFAKKKAIP
jgi:hypothetical protein